MRSLSLTHTLSLSLSLSLSVPPCANEITTLCLFCISSRLSLNRWFSSVHLFSFPNGLETFRRTAWLDNHRVCLSLSGENLISVNSWSCRQVSGLVAEGESSLSRLCILIWLVYFSQWGQRGWWIRSDLQRWSWSNTWAPICTGTASHLT